VVEETLERVPAREAGSVEEVLEIDARSREMARKVVRERIGTHEEHGQMSVQV